MPKFYSSWGVVRKRRLWSAGQGTRNVCKSSGRDSNVRRAGVSALKCLIQSRRFISDTSALTCARMAPKSQQATSARQELIEVVQSLTQQLQKADEAVSRRKFHH